MNRLKWVRIKLLAEMTGLTVPAIREYRKKGIWRDGIHMVKAPNGTIYFNPEEIEKWIEGKVV